jgi:UDP-glucose 4-epimerase
MRLLVTGSRGFIGSEIGRYAAAAGHTVLGVSRASQPGPGWPGGHRCLDVVDADLVPVVEDFRPDAIVHAAGPASVGDSFVAPAASLRAAVLGWTNVLESLRRSGSPTRAVLLSSAAVYGQPAVLPVTEDEPCRPLSPYGYSKLVCELLAQQYLQCFSVDTVVCRLFSVVGPTQHRLLAWEVYRQLADPAHQVVVLKGSAGSIRDYLHVGDAAEAIVALCHAIDPPTRVNVASGRGSTVGEVVTTLRALTGSMKDCTFLMEQGPGDPDMWQAEVSTLRRALGRWQPRELHEALADCVAHWSKP